jgi:hypothetical protein
MSCFESAFAMSHFHSNIRLIIAPTNVLSNQAMYNGSITNASIQLNQLPAIIQGEKKKYEKQKTTPKIESHQLQYAPKIRW